MGLHHHSKEFGARRRNAGGRGREGTAYPAGGRGFSEASGRSAPGGPPARRGPHFSREIGRKRAGGKPPEPPGFMARLLPLARFGVCATLSRWRGYYGTHVWALIWRLSFIKCFFSIFFPENAFQIGLRIPEGIVPRTDPGQQPPKRASANERAINQGGGAGGIPPRLFASGLSLEKAWIPARDRAGTHLAGANLRRSKPGPPADGREGPPGPAGQAGPPGRCAPRWLPSHPPEGYALGPPAPPGMGSELPL